MISINTAIRSITILATAGLLGACGGNGADAPDGDVPGTEMSGMEGHDMSSMAAHDMGEMDPAVMQQHVAEIDIMAKELSAHVAQMRQLQTDQWHSRMDVHVPLVSRLLGMMDRHMSEMRMNMPMDSVHTGEMVMDMPVDSAHMGAMLHMSGEEHGAMMEHLTALRSEVTQLQTATPAEVSAQMPAHLDRLERIIATMESSADRMGGR